MALLSFSTVRSTIMASPLFARDDEGGRRHQCHVLLFSHSKQKGKSACCLDGGRAYGQPPKNEKMRQGQLARTLAFISRNKVRVLFYVFARSCPFGFRQAIIMILELHQ